MLSSTVPRTCCPAYTAAITSLQIIRVCCLCILQGQIGKFGSLELSDVASFIELPDGKVLSGCESGAMLLWDGGLIKTVILQPGGEGHWLGVQHFSKALLVS